MARTQSSDHGGTSSIDARLVYLSRDGLPLQLVFDTSRMPIIRLRFFKISARKEAAGSAE